MNALTPFLLLLSFLYIPLMASDQALSEFKMQEIEALIEKRQTTTHSLRAQFTQSVLPKNHSQAILSEGVIQYQQPQKLRIDFKNPEGEGMILTATETTTWKKGLLPKSLPHDPLKPSFKRIILDILEKKPSDWDSLFHKTMKQEGDSLLVTLIPLSPDERSPEQVQVIMRSNDLQITAISVAMKGVHWKVQFHSLQVNTPLKIKLTR
jgi:outer membrane lipoprotein-sorting protein